VVMCSLQVVTVPKVIRPVVESDLSFLWSLSLNLLYLVLHAHILEEMAGLFVDNASYRFQNT
jgi:hypothetical protein